MKSQVTVCVIDDVKAVVNGISNNIAWEEHGVRIVGTALDGEEGLRLIREKQPQIVITDIRMPKLSGIDLIERLTEEGISSKVIFISGFSDFEYAQTAVRLGASDYVLKPFTSRQILDAVLKAKQFIEAERDQSDKLAEWKKKVHRSLPYLRQEYFRLLLRYEANPEKLDERWEFLEIDMSRSSFVVMVAEIDQFAERTRMLPAGEVELIRFAIENILEETLHSHTRAIVFKENINEIIAVFNPPNKLEGTALMELCRENVEKHTKQTVAIGLGSEVRSIQNVHVSFEQAKTALSYQFYSGGNGVLTYSELTGSAPISPRYSADKEKELLYALRSGNGSKAERLLEEIFLECSQYPSNPDPAIMTNLFYGLAFSVYRTLAEQVGEPERIRLESALAKAKGDTALTLNGWKEFVKDYCLQGCELAETRRHKISRKVVEEFKAYIEEHLLSNLTVTECAKAVHLSPSYFANLFKKETGLTLMQYVTQQRMERAKHLLLEGMQVQEISLVLGYEDRPYFSELFKKHIGMTPSDFRLSYAEDNETR